METLAEITSKILECCREGEPRNSPSDVWHVLNHIFYRSLGESTVQQISGALELDVNLDLPFYLACDLHQKRIYLDDSNPTYFLEFANFLRFNSNSWTYLADYFDKVAARLNMTVQNKSV